MIKDKNNKTKERPICQTPKISSFRRFETK